jgi:hypothetical protein
MAPILRLTQEMGSGVRSGSNHESITGFDLCGRNALPPENISDRRSGHRGKQTPDIERRGKPARQKADHGG